MQDIVGFRVVVPGIIDQDNLCARVPAGDVWQIVDRRQRPSHGYRAVHLIRRKSNIGAVEVQVRTRFQHEWAELSERLERAYPGTKYGKGKDPEWTEILHGISKNIADSEQVELAVQQSRQGLVELHRNLVELLEAAMKAVPETKL